MLLHAAAEDPHPSEFVRATSTPGVIPGKQLIPSSAGGGSGETTPVATGSLGITTSTSARPKPVASEAMLNKPVRETSRHASCTSREVMMTMTPPALRVGPGR